MTGAYWTDQQSGSFGAVSARPSADHGVLVASSIKVDVPHEGEFLQPQHHIFTSHNLATPTINKPLEYPRPYRTQPVSSPPAFIGHLLSVLQNHRTLSSPCLPAPLPPSPQSSSPSPSLVARAVTAAVATSLAGVSSCRESADVVSLENTICAGKRHSISTLYRIPIPFIFHRRPSSSCVSFATIIVSSIDRARVICSCKSALLFSALSEHLPVVLRFVKMDCEGN